MGFISDLFDSEVRRRKRIASLTKKIQQKFGQTDDRLAAAYDLRKLGGEDGIKGLLKRFSHTCDNKMHDQDEKNAVSDMLAEMGPQILPPVREFLERETEVTWVLRTARRVQTGVEWIGLVVETLSQKTSEDTDPEKICQILTVLHEQKDGRVAPAIARCLTDLDDTVRFAAVEALATVGDEIAREPLLAALTRADEESQRVIQRIIEVFQEHNWEVKGFRKTVEERLPEGFYLDRSGRIKRLEAGAIKAPDA